MIYGEIICKDKVAEITPDGIAAAAAVLATHYSKHLRDSPELTDAFWYFFSKLAGQQKVLERMIKAEEIWTEMADRLRERLPERIWDALDEAYCNQGLQTPIQDLEPGDVKGVGRKSIQMVRQHLIAHIKEQ